MSGCGGRPGCMARPNDQLSQAVSDLAAEVLARPGDGPDEFDAGTVELIELDVMADWASGPQLQASSSKEAVSRRMLGWAIPQQAVGAFVVGGTDGARFSLVVLRDGTSHSSGAVPPPFAWMARRCVGLPSGARCRKPREVAMARVYQAVLRSIDHDEPATRQAIMDGTLSELIDADGLVERARHGASWEELRALAGASSPIAAWADDDLYGFIAAYGLGEIDDLRAQLKERLDEPYLSELSGWFDSPW